MKNNTTVFLATRSYQEHLERYLSVYSGMRCDVRRESFPDGEIDLCLPPLFFKSTTEVVIFSGTVSDAESMELWRLCDHLSTRVRSITIVLHYVGDARGDRETAPGQVVRAKAAVSFLTTLPRAKEMNRIYVMDLHNEDIAHWFPSTSVQVIPISLAGMWASVLPTYVSSPENLLVLSPDEGRRYYAESISAQIPGSSFGNLIKRRISGSETKMVGFFIPGPIEEKEVVIVDDMISTGGSMAAAVRFVLANGAKGVLVCASHPVCGRAAVQKQFDAGASQVLFADTYPTRLLQQGSDRGVGSGIVICNTQKTIAGIL